MENISFLENPLNVYLLKQKEFKRYVKEIQHSINSKEYTKKNCTIDEFVKSKWNISKTQAYRYLLCAKIIDQLEEFEIQPNYERLCRSLNKYAKTTQQLKLLWGMILKKINKNVELITSSLVTKTWDELCRDKNYSNICNFEKSIMTKIENTFKEHSKKAKQNQLKSSYNNVKSYPLMMQNQNDINKNYLVSPKISSQCMIIPTNECVYDENVYIYKIEDQYESSENFLLFSNNAVEPQVNYSLSPLSSYSSPLSSNSSLSPIIQNNEINYFLPSTEYINQYPNENLFIPLNYAIPTQQTIIYY